MINKAILDLVRNAVWLLDAVHTITAVDWCTCIWRIANILEIFLCRWKWKWKWRGCREEEKKKKKHKKYSKKKSRKSHHKKKMLGPWRVLVVSFISTALMLPLVDQILRFIRMVSAPWTGFTHPNTLHWYAQALHHMLRTGPNGY